MDKVVWGMIFDSENKLYFKERIGNHTGAICRMNFGDAFINLFDVDVYDCFDKSLRTNKEKSVIYSIIGKCTLGAIYNLDKYQPSTDKLDLNGDLIIDIIPFAKNDLFVFFRNGNYSYLQFENKALSLKYSEDRIPV